MAPDNMVLISGLLVFIEVALIINALVHLEMAKDVLCKEVVSSLSWASISVQEL
jgi:hypothetical protein